VSLLVAAAGAWAPPAGAQGATTVGYSVREARAYVYRVSLSPEVIEAAGLQDQFAPCDPAEDPYQCDETEYEHAPNCPDGVALGRGEAGPAILPAPGAAVTEGGSGDSLGPEEAPPLASPITLNQQVAVGSLGRLGNVREASGLASDSYVDLSGRQEPTMHTESDAFTPNRSSYEERCAPDGATEDEHAHFLSRSSEAPETYHLAECREECTFGGAAIGAESEEARTLVHLSERGGRLEGLVHASMHDAVWAGGTLTADLLDTTLRFTTDGTPGGLDYSVSTTAVGVTFNGVPIALPPGEPVAVPGAQIGVAAPYVNAPTSGRALDVVAPGLFIATSTQTVLFGGVELSATMGRQTATGGFTGGDDDDDDVDSGLDGDGSSLPPIGPGPTASPTPAPTATGGPDAADPELAVSRIRTGGWIVPMFLGAGLLAALLLLMRWLGRYPWGRRMYRAQPFRTIDWIYRAFVKT
jgi:hypothetical protein